MCQHTEAISIDNIFTDPCYLFLSLSTQPIGSFSRKPGFSSSRQEEAATGPANYKKSWFELQACQPSWGLWGTHTRSQVFDKDTDHRAAK